MLLKVKHGFVFHSKDERGLPIVYLAGEIVDFQGVGIPAQLEISEVAPVNVDAKPIKAKK